MYKIRYVGKQAVKIYVKNNRSKVTVFFIHGFSSSHKFASMLYDLDNKYNIIAIDLYNADKPQQINFAKMSNVASSILKKIKTKNIILFGHSLGGGILSQIYNKSSSIKEIVWMSTINPLMVSDITFKALKAHHNDDGSKVLKAISGAIQKKVNSDTEGSASMKWISKFLDKDSPWAKVMSDTLFNESFIKSLEDVYVKTKLFSTHIIGERDGVVTTNTYKNFIKQIGGNSLTIGKGHNPIKTDPNAINEILNNISKAYPGTNKKKVLKWR